MNGPAPYAALLVVALLLVACDGTKGGPDATPTPTREPTQTPTVAPATTKTPLPTQTPAIPDASPSTALDLPDGFTAYAIANGFYRATSIALAADGTIYVSERHGSVYRLADDDGDGVFEQRVRFAGGAATRLVHEDTDAVTGIVFAPDGSLYVAATGRVVAVSDTDGDGVGDATRDVIGDLPTGLHQNNGMVFGPDGRLYTTNGSTCDQGCDEADERSATILQSNVDGSDLRVYAHGLRNTYDLVFDGQGRLWATDNGSDAPCATIDELNLIVDGGDYGWPYGERCDEFQSGIPPVGDLGLHTAATGIDEYDGVHFPAQYRGNLFLTLWGRFGGSSGDETLVLRRVVVEETADGPRATVLPFASGFEHPIDVLTDSDGTLLVLDYGSGREGTATGTLYRIVYTGG